MEDKNDCVGQNKDNRGAAYGYMPARGFQLSSSLYPQKQLLDESPKGPSKNNRQDPKETSVVTDLKEASLVKSTLEPYFAIFPHFKPEAQIFPLSKLSQNHLDRISCEM